MKRYQLVVLIICVALLSMSATLLFYSFFKVRYIEAIPMDIKVSDHIGINIDADALHFGAVMETGCNNRFITVKHKYDYPMKVMISIIGELEAWTSIEENDFILNKNEEREIRFTVCPPEDVIKYKNYTGTARIVVKRI